jgi:hypothetical protein
MKVLIFIALVGAYAGFIWSWAQTYKMRVDPWLRRWIGQRLGIRIIWQRSDRDVGWTWAITGEEQSKAHVVSLVAICVWWCATFAPVLLLALALAFGFVRAGVAYALLLANFPLALVFWRHVVPSHK